MPQRKSRGQKHKQKLLTISKKIGNTEETRRESVHRLCDECGVGISISDLQVTSYTG